MDIVPDAAGNVHREVPPQGLSGYDAINAIPTTGWIWRLPSDVPMPEGLEVAADPPPVGHYVFGPARTMSLQDYLKKLAELRWVKSGSKKR